MYLGKVGDDLVLDEGRHSLSQTARDILHQAVTMSLVQHLQPELSRLAEVVLLAGVIALDIASDLPVALLRGGTLLGAVEGVGMVVGGVSLAVVGHVAASLGIMGAGTEGTVDRQLDVVRPETVEMRIGVGEETALEHLVRGELDSGDDVGRTESGLLHLEYGNL